MERSKKSAHEETLVSVIIPCYNGERFIGEAIESVISQTHQNWELIVVDDGSTDSSKDIVRQYTTDRRIKLIEHRCNKGIPKTKNDGLSVAQGGYIAFLDQDDIWMPSKLELQLSRFESESNIGLVCAGMVFMDENMKSRRIFTGFNDTNQKELVKSLYWSPTNSSSIMMIKRECLSQVGTFDENLVAWDDYELLMRIATQFRVRYVRRPLVRKRVYSVNANRKDSHSSQAVRNESEKVFEHVLTLHPFLRRYKNFNEAWRFYSESIELLEQGEKDPARKKLRKSIERNPRYFRAKFLYILSALPGQSSLKIRGIILTAIKRLTLLKVLKDWNFVTKQRIGSKNPLR